MERRLGYAGRNGPEVRKKPSAADIEAIARASLERLPEPFASHLRHVVLTVDELADDQTLQMMASTTRSS